MSNTPNKEHEHKFKWSKWKPASWQTKGQKTIVRTGICNCGEGMTQAKLTVYELTTKVYEKGKNES